MTHIEAMKQWLEALEYINDGANNQGAHTGISWRCVSNKAQPAIASLRQAIAEAEKQEPVAYLNPDDLCADTAFRWCKIDAFTKPVYTTPPQRTEQEPVIDKSAAIRIATALGWEPKREWVGLTEEEIEQGCKESWVTLQAWQSAVWWAEAKLKQKNQ